VIKTERVLKFQVLIISWRTVDALRKYAGGIFLAASCEATASSPQGDGDDLPVGI